MTFSWQVYRDDPLWVPPLLPEHRKVIDPSQGAFFARGRVAEFAIAWRNGRPVGTIAAAEDLSVNEARRTRECIFGFFEYIQDEDVFAALVNGSTLEDVG